MHTKRKPRRLTQSVFMVVLVVLFGISPLCYAEETGEEPSAEKIRKETRELIDEIRSYSADQRDAAMERTGRALDRLDERMEALKKHINENWDEMNEKAREEARAALDALGEQRARLAEWYDAMKDSSADTWERMKKGFSDAYRNFYEAWEKTRRDLGSDQ